MGEIRCGTARVDEALARRLAALDREAFPARLGYDAEEYLRRGRAEGAWLALAEDEGRLVGLCLAARDLEEPRALFLDVLATLPGWRRRGVAARLVEMCVAHARREGHRMVRLTCEPRTEEGVDLVEVYRRLGFRVAAVEPDHVVMALDLTP